MKICIDRPVDPFQAMRAAQQENPQNVPEWEHFDDEHVIQALQQRMAALNIRNLTAPPSDISYDVLATAMPQTFRQIEDRMLDQMAPRMRMRILSSKQRSSLPMLYLALMTQKRWPNRRVLRVAFLGGDPIVHGRIIEFARQWETYTNIHFDFLTDRTQPSDIRIAFDPMVSWSCIGTDALLVPPTEPTMNFGWLTATSSDDTYSRVVLHEFGHALGAIHEHQHPEAGIPWDKEAVYTKYGQPPNNWTREQTDINLFEKYSHDQLNYSAFDPASIMLYAIPNQLTLGDWEVGWNSQLSTRDKEFIATMYPKDDSPSGRTPNGTVDLAFGVPVQSAIEAPSQVKIFRFNVDTEGVYIFETTGLMDTVMALHKAENGTEPILTDDDSGDAWNARIMAQLAPGTYEVRVQHYLDDATGSFAIVVK